MWLYFLLAHVPKSFADDSAFLLQYPSYLKFVTIYSQVAVVPCTLKVVTEGKIEQAIYSFSATPIIWFSLIITFAYSRHRIRMILAEKSRYDRACFVKRWFDNQRKEEKERGVHEIDATVRSNEFRYNDVKVTNEAFQILCKEVDISSVVRYNGWSSVIYINRRIHRIIAVMSLILCLIASFTLCDRAVQFEDETVAIRSHIDRIIRKLKSAGITGKTLPISDEDPKLCTSKALFFPSYLDERKDELISSAVKMYLRGSNDAATRMSSMLLVLFGFFTMFHVWLTAFITSTFKRKSSALALQHHVCLLASERHTQLASFVLPIIIVALIVIEDAILHIA